jgi:hypothetical protein
MIFSMATFRFAGLALDTAEREKNGEQAYGPLARRNHGQVDAQAGPTMI